MSPASRSWQQRALHKQATDGIPDVYLSTATACIGSTAGTACQTVSALQEPLGVRPDTNTNMAVGTFRVVPLLPPLGAAAHSTDSQPPPLPTLLHHDNTNLCVQQSNSQNILLDSTHVRIPGQQVCPHADNRQLQRVCMADRQSARH
jgi:hypothetical protein